MTAIPNPNALRTLDFQPQSQPQYDVFVLLMDAVTRSVGFGGGAGGGKSFVGVAWIWMMCTIYAGVRYFFGRKELKRLKQTTYASYLKFCELYEIPLAQRGIYNDKTSTLTFPNGSEIIFLDLAYKPSDPFGGTFGSLEFTGGFIDESWEVNAVYVRLLYTRIGRWKNEQYGIFAKVLETFNPDKGHCYTRFYKPYRSGTESERTRFVPALAIDRLKQADHFRRSHTLHPDDQGTELGQYIEGLLDADETTKQRLLYGNFDYDDDPTALIEYSAIEDFFDAQQVQPDPLHRYLTADIAGRGSDKFVVMIWYGWVVVELVEMAKSGGREVLDLITDLARKHTVRESHIAYDNDGLGFFIGGQGGFLPGALPFRNGARPLKVDGKEENYFNLKTQVYYHLARRIRQGTIAFHAPRSEQQAEDIRQELGQIKTFAADTDGKIKMKPKKLVKADIGRSPDYTDTLAMRCYFDLVGSSLVQYL